MGPKLIMTISSDLIRAIVLKSTKVLCQSATDKSLPEFRAHNVVTNVVQGMHMKLQYFKSTEFLLEQQVLGKWPPLFWYLRGCYLAMQSLKAERLRQDITAFWTSIHCQ